MALRFWSGWAVWLSYEYLGSRYDAHHIRGGLGAVLAVSIWTTNLADNEIKDLPEDDIGYKVIAWSLIISPGYLWGMALLWLFREEPETMACVWLVISTVLLAMLGICAFTGQRARWYAANACGALGVLAGHFLSHSDIGNTIESSISGVVTSTASSKVRAMMGVLGMAGTVARLVRNRLRTTST